MFLYVIFNTYGIHAIEVEPDFPEVKRSSPDV